ncbi:MAG: class I SAM-dependent methyltransferase [Psychroserpens sp.]|uniref:class I SAM-dependent methyltransferase n=1 Tax=Psychroserpens sp. TaxID=2020870 RepID=UPI00300142FD
MEYIKCIFCHSEANDVVIEENGYTGVQCRTCNLIYINPRPKFDDIVDLYGHDNAHASAESHIDFLYAKTLYTKHTLQIIKKYAEGALLEIGAGAGYFLKEAQRQKFEVYAIEFNKIQADFILEKHRIPCELTALNENTFGTKKFDVIYHCDVLSHFYSPIMEFGRMYNKLNPEGYVVFETGNLGDVNKSYFKYYPKFQYPDHLFFFNESNIKALLNESGFELIKMYRYSILPQLFLKKVLLKLTNIIKPRKIKSIDIKKKDLVQYIIYFYSKLFFAIRNKLKNVYAYLFYLIRYKLGSIMLKKGVPQTMIIVARKKSER